jgi:NAD(P)H-nitrite reductase large subunit
MNVTHAENFASNHDGQSSDALLRDCSSAAPITDFELIRLEDGLHLHVCTMRGRHWLRANFLDWNEDDQAVTLMAANTFLRESRKNSLRTHYVGPVEPIVL